MKTRSGLKIIFSILLGAAITACGGKTEQSKQSTAEKEVTVEASVATNSSGKSIGIGPIKEVKLIDIDQSMVENGKVIFEEKCSACHKTDSRYIGPALKGVTERRSPEWVMNMILNPEQMVKEDPTAKALLAEYLAPMANQNLTEEEARKVLEYFRTIK